MRIFAIIVYEHGDDGCQLFIYQLLQGFHASWRLSRAFALYDTDHFYVSLLCLTGMSPGYRVHSMGTSFILNGYEFPLEAFLTL